MTEPLSQEEINALLAGIETSDTTDTVEDKVKDHQKIMDEHKRTYEQTGTTAALSNLAESYKKMGDYLMESRPRTHTQILSEEEINALLSIIASGEEDLGQFINKEPEDSAAPKKSTNNSFEDIKSFYQNAVNAREQIYNETGTIESLNDLSAIYKVMSSFLISFGPDEGALEYCQKAIDIRKDIHKHTATVDSLKALARTYCKYLRLIPDHLKQDSRFRDTEAVMKLEHETIVYKDDQKFFVMFVQKTDDVFLALLSTIPENNEAIDFGVYEICCSDTDAEKFAMRKYS